MKTLLIGYLVRFIIGAIALGVGIWYVSSSLENVSITYISLDSFLKSIGATDGNIASANGCFLCGYVNDLFVVLGNASELFWNAILDNLWVLMVFGFGIFVVVHTIKFFYKAMNDAIPAVGGGIGAGAGAAASGGSGSSTNAAGPAIGATTGKALKDAIHGTNLTDDVSSSGGETSGKAAKYKYAQLEWLACDGQQQTLTRIRPTNATGIKIKFNQSVPGDQAVVWSFITAKGRTSMVFGVHVANTLFLPFNEVWTAGDVGVNVATNSDYEVSINYKNDRKRYVNGVSKLDITNTLDSGGFFYLFKNYDDLDTHIANFHGRIYYLQITEGASLVRNMVPVQKIVDGEPKGDIGMYDLVSREYHPNIGSGKFTAGPIVGYLEKI